MGVNLDGHKFEKFQPIDISTPSQNYKIYSSYYQNLRKHVTIFQSKPDHFTYAQNSIQILKILRMPNILNYITSIIDEKTSNKNIYIITSSIIPLKMKIEKMTFSEKLYGLYNIGKALQFINEKCQIIHNNVSDFSIFLYKNDKTEKWVLGNFEYSCRMKNMTKEWIMDINEKKKKMNPEDINIEKLKKMKKYKIYTRDIYSFALLIKQVLKGEDDDDEDEGMKKFLEKILEQKKVKPNLRPNYEYFLNLKIFKTNLFVKIMNSLDNLKVLDSEKKSEKKIFFQNLFNDLKGLSLEIIKKRIIKRILTVQVISDTYSNLFLPHLFSREKGFGVFTNLNEYEKIVGNFIRLSYHSTNRAVRIKVLQMLNCYIKYLDFNEIVNYYVPKVLFGLYDSDQNIVINTMNSLILLIKHFERYDEENDVKNLDNSGMNFVNMKILPILHHFSVKNVSTRANAILSLIELWNVKRINKGIILSTISNAIYDENFEINIHIINTLTLHYNKFHPIVLIKIIIPMLLNLVLNKRIEIREKTNSLIKLILSDFNDVNVVIEPKILKRGVILKQVFPEQSHKDIIVRPQLFSGTIYKSVTPNVGYSPNDDKVNLDQKRKEVEKKNEEENDNDDEDDDEDDEDIAWDEIEDVENKENTPTETEFVQMGIGEKVEIKTTIKKPELEPKEPETSIEIKEPVIKVEQPKETETFIEIKEPEIKVEQPKETETFIEIKEPEIKVEQPELEPKEPKTSIEIKEPEIKVEQQQTETVKKEESNDTIVSKSDKILIESEVEEEELTPTNESGWSTNLEIQIEENNEKKI